MLKPKKVRWPRHGRRLRRSSELPNRSLSRKEVQSILKRRRNDCHRHHRYIIKNQQIHVQMFQVETLASVLLGFALWIVRVNVGIKHHPTSAKIPKTGHLPTVHLQLRHVEKRVLVWSPPQPTAPRRGRPAGPISMTNSQWSGTNLGLWSPLEKWCKMVQGC